MFYKINVYFTKQTISQCVFIDFFLTTFMHQSSSLMAKDELMQGCPDPVLKCPEQAQFRLKTQRDCVSRGLGQDISV